MVALQQEVCKLREYQDNLELQLSGGADKPAAFRDDNLADASVADAKAPARKRDLVSEGLAEAGKTVSNFFTWQKKKEPPADE